MGFNSGFKGLIRSRYVLMFNCKVLRCAKASSNLLWHSQNTILIPKKIQHNWIIPKFHCFAVAKTNHTQTKNLFRVLLSPRKTHHHKDGTVTAELCNVTEKKNVYIIYNYLHPNIMRFHKWRTWFQFRALTSSQWTHSPILNREEAQLFINGTLKHHKAINLVFMGPCIVIIF